MLGPWDDLAGGNSDVSLAGVDDKQTLRSRRSEADVEGKQAPICQRYIRAAFLNLFPLFFWPFLSTLSVKRNSPSRVNEKRLLYFRFPVCAVYLHLSKYGFAVVRACVCVCVCVVCVLLRHQVSTIDRTLQNKRRKALSQHYNKALIFHSFLCSTIEVNSKNIYTAKEVCARLPTEHLAVLSDP